MFWLVVGILLGVGFMLLARSNVKLAWFDWVFLVLAVVFGLLAYQNYTASIEELEGKAATLLLFAFGIPAAIFAGIVIFRQVRKPAAPKPS